MVSGTEASLAAERAVPVTVLIVDDEDTTRNLCRDVVSESGLRTKLASTTEQALDILDQSAVDIVITDLRVPQLGGLVFRLQGRFVVASFCAFVTLPCPMAASAAPTPAPTTPAAATIQGPAV